MAFSPFVPLRVLSSYSMLEGAVDPKAIARLAKERAFPAIAICDRNGLYGAPAFASACKADGVQPIVGTLLGVARDSGEVDYLPLYAQDEAGWQNLCHLVSLAHLDRPLELAPHVPMDALIGHTDGLIALTGAGEGGVTRLLASGKLEAGAQLVGRFLDGVLPQRHGIGPNGGTRMCGEGGHEHDGPGRVSELRARKLDPAHQIDHDEQKPEH